MRHLFLALLLATTALAEDEVTRVFLFAGQSNMVGSDSKVADIERFPPFAGLDAPQQDVRFLYVLGRENKTRSDGWVALQPVNGIVGPELSFAREVTRQVDAPIAVIKVAAGGTHLGGDWNPDQPQGFEMYPLLLETVRGALAELDREEVPYRLEGLMWHQGENDMFDAQYMANYGANLTNFLGRLRRDLEAPDLRVYVGELCTKTIWGMDLRPRMFAISQGQKAATGKDPLAEYVPTSHVGVEIGNPVGLHYHYGTLGQLEHGVNYAAAYLAHQGIEDPGRAALERWPHAEGSAVELFVLAGHRNMEGERAFVQELDRELTRDQDDIPFRYSTGGGVHVSNGWEPLGPAGLYDTFGPEVSFGRALDRGTRGPIAIVKFTHSGSQIIDWTPEGSEARDRNLYPAFLSFVQESIEDLEARGHRVELAGVVYHVGENDMSFHPFRREAAKRIGAWIAQTREDLEQPELTFYLSQQPPTDHESVNGVDVIADVAALAAADEHVVHLVVDGLPPQDRRLVIDTAGTVWLGEWLAKQVLADRGAWQIVPRPTQLVLHGGEVTVSTVGCDARFAEQVGVLVEAWGDAARPVEGDAPADLRFVHVPTLPSEAYAVVGDGPIEVHCGDAAGAARAAASLWQLARRAGDALVLPVLEVRDQPRFPFRGMMVDMGRNPHGPETLRRLVDLCWLVKANVLHLHLTDDQLFSWPSRAYPKLYSERAGWTWKDFEALEAYAVARGVMLVPEIDVPGHSTILRREYPEVFGETPTDLATSDAALEGVATLIGEFCSVFTSSRYVHVGGDEAYGVPAEAQRSFLNRLDRVVRAQGRTTLVWEGPGLGEGDNKVAETVVHVNWNTVNFRAQAMLDAGYPVINASWDPFYVVDHYPRTMFTAVSLDRLYGWDPRNFGHIDPGYPTFEGPHRTDTSEGLLGFLMPWWEGREENVLALCAPRLATAAAVGWNRGAEQDFAAFLPRLEALLARYETLVDVELPHTPYADPGSEEGNLAYRGRVTASAGEHQPHFGPERLTNGFDDRFDHFLGFPTKPAPLEIVVELPEPSVVGRIVVHETAVGGSHELYELWVSADGESWEQVGATDATSRGEASFVEHRLDPRRVAQVKVVTRGCHGLTFSSFSRLTEIRAFAD